MISLAIYTMIYLGAALMVVNIYSFVSFARYIQNRKSWDANNKVMVVPIVLLTFFLLGYLFVGIFGKPDIMMAAILFFGSVFVYVMYRLLKSITGALVESEKIEAEYMAAEEANAVKSRLLASVSHEMRTPMNVILGLSKVVLSDPDLKQENREQLEEIDSSATHLLGLINRILELNQLENNEFDLNEKPFNLKNSLNKLDSIIMTLCNEKGLNYVTSYSEAVNREYLGDETMLTRALMNILENAVKYTEAPGQVAFVVEEKDVNDKEAVLEFTIEDSGIGIDEEFLPKVFELFSQEDPSTTSRFGGSGIGLALSSGIIRQMNGNIIVNSMKGQGSTFTVTVPLKINEAVKEEERNEDVSLEGKRILIVEDIDENAEIVADLLDLEGAVTERAENGQIAVAMVSGSEEYYYDAILMDLRMPVMDGFEATEAIRDLDRKDTKDIPIIALTANAFKEDVDRSLASGMNAHLAKPADADELYATIRRNIAEADRRREGGQ